MTGIPADSERCTKEVFDGRAQHHRCVRKAVRDRKCAQHAGVVSSAAPAPAFYACPEIDDAGRDMIVIEEIEVRWENDEEVMLARQPRGLFVQKIRKEFVPRTREAAMKRLIEQSKSKIAYAMSVIKQHEKLLTVAKEYESQMGTTGKTEFLREKKP